MDEFSGRLMQVVQGPHAEQEGLLPLPLHLEIMGFPWLSNVPRDSCSFFFFFFFVLADPPHSGSQRAMSDGQG